MTLRERLVGLEGVRFVTPGDRDDQGGAIAAEASSVEAEVVGGGDFEIIDVPELGRSEFTHFLDGAQRSWQVLFHRLAPVYLSYVSAAILERVDRDLQPPAEATYRGGLVAFVADNPALAELLREELTVISVPAKDVAAGGLEDLLKQGISDHRDAMERELAQRFAGPGKLLIDGGLGNALKIQGEQPVVVGVVKSHRRQYFRSARRTDLVLGMTAGQRSSLFIRAADRRQGESVHSFYLRLQASDQAGPLYGIVRVEIPADRGYDPDEVAGWLLHERAPLSLPDPRFDRLLYPIRLVEEHLRARQPSTAAIRGLIQ